ncbi:MAG: hypothetical protein KDA28_10685, partial [Phycisphaerales bacterium]|nr:hypothetical protein [Phycisphaerales bacterium]
GLTAYVTPWGGINLVGMDARGEVVVTWWVPQFDDEWQQHNLSRTLDHPGMVGDSLASYVTPWGGTNVAGIDEDGDLVVYWWSPASVDWQVSPLSALVPNAVLPLRSIEGLASPTGLISLFGFTDGEEPVRYHWAPGGSWTAELLRGP